MAALFTLTGAVALLLEQAFEKMLSTLLGSSTPAAATVLGVYFAGLSLGGLAYGRWIRPRTGQPLRVYAVLEGGIGVWSLLMYRFFDELIPVFVPLLALGLDHFWLLQCLRVVVAVCWIMPLTTLMGASFPAIVDALAVMRIPNQGRAMSRFYMFNLVGGLLGVFSGLYFIFPGLGIDGALLAAFGVNLTVCGIAIALAQGSKDHLGPVDPRTLHREKAPLKLQGTSMLLVVAFVSGFVFFSLEVLWTHLISAVMGNSIYAFGTMLAIVLLGLGCGAGLVSALSSPKATLSAADLSGLVLGSVIILTVFFGFWPSVPKAFLVAGNVVQTFWQGELVRWLVALFMLLPAATSLGMIYPALFRLDFFPERERGTVAGQLGAVNAVGCILGALVCGFGLIPLLGSENTMRLLIMLTALCGLGLYLAYLRGRRRLAGTLLAVMTIFVAFWQPAWNRLGLTSGMHVYFAPRHVWPQTELRYFHEDTLGGITTVVENRSGGVIRTLLTNGKFQGNDSGEQEAQVGFALVPMMFTAAFGEALVIGLGTGHSAYVVQTMGFRTIDIAEISPGIVQAARNFFQNLNGGVMDQPNVRVFLEDGRNVLLLRQKKYDMITMEITSVWFSGATSLYSMEFYNLVKRRLKPGGVFQQWIQLHHIGRDEVVNVLATLRRVFPYVSFWVVGGQGILVGSETDQIIQPGFLTALQARGRNLGWDEAGLPKRFQTLLSSRLLAPGDTTELAKSCTRVNTDRNRVMEYATPKHNLSRTDHVRDNIATLAGWASFPPPSLPAAGGGRLGEAGRQVTEPDYRKTLGLLRQVLQ
jgi:spermidine synthase